jgi:hypothetical protein
LLGKLGGSWADGRNVQSWILLRLHAFHQHAASTADDPALPHRAEPLKQPIRAFRAFDGDDTATYRNRCLADIQATEHARRLGRLEYRFMCSIVGTRSRQKVFG